MNLFKKVAIIFLISVGSSAYAATYYVSTNGSNSNRGTISEPWLTWSKAFSTAQAGDTVYFRGGIYYSSVTDGTGYSPQINGAITDTICFVNYPDEVPVLDFSNVKSTTGNMNYGLRMNLKYVKIKGLTVRNVWQLAPSDECVGWQISGSHIVIENCTVYNIGGAGFRDFNCTEIHFINCDAHDCYDLLTTSLPGNDGYGFASWNGTTRTGSTYFKNCRAWKNGDDGFAFWNISYVETDNCWSFCNGLMEGGGEGFKLGFTANYSSIPLQRVVKNCFAAYNRIAGFFTNEAASTPSQHMMMYNNTSYHNGYYPVYPTYGFGFWVDNSSSSDKEELARIFKNNISFANKSAEIFITAGGLYTHSFNSWDHSPSYTITNTDFVSLDSTGISGPRHADGSLPDLDFLKLAASSDFIDAGTNVGIPYNGKAPDLGWFESSSGSSSTTIPVYVSSKIANSTPSSLEMNYNLALANIVPAASAFTVSVNSVVRSVNSLAISGTKVLLTLSSPVVYGEVVTVAYTKPVTNPLQTTSGGQAGSISAQNVTNNTIRPANISPTVVITSPGNNSTFAAPAIITITADAFDPDGTIALVEFYNGMTRLGSKSSTPFNITWNNVVQGTYSITAVATDDIGAKTTSPAISVLVSGTTTTNPDNQLPSVAISNPTKGNNFDAPADIDIEVIATDPDGKINKVELFNGTEKIAELTSSPYSFTWKSVNSGTYQIKAFATDNSNATATSSMVEFTVGDKIRYDANSEIINLYPNPNNGIFTIEFLVPQENAKNEIIISDLSGHQVYCEKISIEETTKHFNLPNIVSGIYIMMIISREIIVTKKIIIM
jgi:hypothetical protein